MTGDRIEVEPLGQPSDDAAAILADDQAAADAERYADAGGPPEAVTPDDPARRAHVVSVLAAGVQAPFAVVAVRRGAHWRVTEDEARPVAEALALVLPANALTERLVNLSPWAAVAIQLQALVQVRLDADAALAAPATEEEPRGPRRPPVRSDQGAPGAAAEPPGPGLRREPGADGTGDGAEPYTGAGLGLASPGVGERPAGPRE